MPTHTRLSPPSPISTLPPDVLLEIFRHCLPRHPLRQRQPSTSTAPILLCHVCASWRRLARGFPGLWTHLAYEFTVVAVQRPASKTAAALEDWGFEFTARDIAFVRWWQGHQGRMPPVLAFSVARIARSGAVTAHPTASIAAALVIDVLTAAQHLELDVFFWDFIHATLSSSSSSSSTVLQFPRLHTVRAEHIASGTHPFYALQPRLALPALRRLSLIEVALPPDCVFPEQWGALTDLSLRAALALASWRRLPRALPRRRWGHFDLLLDLSSSSVLTPPPPQCTLPALTTLSIVVRTPSPRSAAFPLSALFAGLHLHAVHTLALAVPGARPWETRSALDELYAALSATPAVTTVIVDDPALALSNPHPHPIPPFPPPLHDAAPVWHPAPALAHLHLTLPPTSATTTEEKDAHLAHFLHALIAPESTWLSLRHPACPLRTITVRCGGGSGGAGPQTQDALAEIRARVGGVVFRVSQDSASVAAADVRGAWGARG